MASQQDPPAQNSGTMVYFPAFLSIYDWYVLWLSNTYLWECPTVETQLPFFRGALGRRHLDIGVGTGFYPSNAIPGSACRELTLVDLNPHSLAKAKSRVESAISKDEKDGSGLEIKTLVADATAPLPLPQDAKFDSISLFFLLHCIPGGPNEKSAVFDSVRPHLAEDGVLVGTTILGPESKSCGWVDGPILRAYNAAGLFSNWRDTRDGFEAGLRRNFDDVDVRVEGRVMLFTARRPKAI
jgi:SAM-dependent methyltransferase